MTFYPFRRAAVDIGTNSTRLLIADIGENRDITPVYYLEELTRLGAGFQPDGTLDAAAVQRVTSAVRSFIATAEQMGARHVRLFATSAVRDAANRKEVVEEIQQQSGTFCRVLTGKEEAQLTFLGAASSVAYCGKWLLCDVGGGSTEFIAAEGARMVEAVSLQLGSNRETRSFLHSDPPTQNEQIDLQRHVRSVLHTLKLLTVDRLVASGGTAFTAAALCANSNLDDPFELEGQDISRRELDELIFQIVQKPLSERRAMPGLPPERAEVLPAGLLIYREIMDFFGARKLKITLRDVLFGAVLEKEWQS